MFIIENERNILRYLERVKKTLNKNIKFIGVYLLKCEFEGRYCTVYKRLPEVNLISFI